MADQQLIDDNESIDSKEDELFGRNDLSIDSDSNDDGFPTLAKIGCSLEDYDIIFKKKHPSNSLWKDAEAPNEFNVSATINGARQDTWNQAIQEINFVKENVQNILGERDPSINNLVDLIFGQKSNIGRLLEEKLEVSSETLLKIIGTFSLAAAYNLSKTQLFGKNSFVNREALTDEDTYTEFWKKAAMYGCKEPGSNAPVRGMKPLWLDVQNALNDTLRRLFIEGFEKYMKITTDDDKMHFQLCSKADTQGLKSTQHVRDNRKGFVAHTACYTASGLPIGIEWERENDDSTAAATERLIRAQLAPTSGQMGPPSLPQTEFAMDRGYCLPSLLYDFFLPSGADIMGTVKRSPMFPFTYDQKLSQNDTRQSVDTKGFKVILLKKLKLKEKQMTGVAYRDGKGGGTLGLTTTESARHWDLVPLISAKTCENSQWFASIRSKKLECYNHHFNNLKVIPLTLKQNTPEWFLLRTFSFTSSTSDNLLVELKKILLDPKLFMLIEEDTKDATKHVLDAAFGRGWDHGAPIQQDITHSLQETSLEENTIPGDVDLVQNHVNLLMSGDLSTENRLREWISHGSLSNEELKSYLEKIGMRPVKERKKNAEKMIKWLNEKPERRPYVLLTKGKLIDECIIKFGGKKSSYENSDTETLIHRLSTYQNDPSYIAIQNRAALDPAPDDNSYLQSLFLKQIVKSSFLPKLTAKGKEYCKMGQNLELPLARKLLQHSKEGLTIFQIDDIYRVGLVGKKHELYSKASCDFIAGAVIGGEEQLVGIECKARVTPRTDQREREHALFLSRFQHISTSTASTTNQLYTIVHADTEDFHLYVDSSHEAVQLLHQAYVFNFKFVLLLIGDASGNIIRGIWVHFNDSLLESYGTVLKFLYMHSLRWAYEPDKQMEMPNFEHVLAENKSIDVESFMGYFYLWKYVSTKLPLPIPHLERIIPYVISRWNSIKGGSDAITKLLWLNMYVPPCSTPQSHAISRMFLLGNVVIHRLHHFFTSKADLEQGYLSLNHFRKAASLRSSFHETLLKIVLSIKQRSSLTLVSSSFISKTNGIQTRKKDTRTKEVAWGAISEGVTPKKFVNEWYKKPPKVPAEVAVHNPMRACTGVPLSRVSVATKSRTDAGSRGSCAECGMLTNNFCITCKKWLCDQQLPANRSANNNCFDDDPRYIKITFDDGILSGSPKTICGIFSCWHKAHQVALEADGALKRGWRCSESDDISSMSTP